MKPENSLMTLEPEALLAFCHIEKAAGTTLIHILRRVFFLRYAAVRPLSDRTGRAFTSHDLEIMRRCNPILSAFGGHSVFPHGELVEGNARLAFITQIREPAARSASQYKFWVNRLGAEPDPELFLKHPASRNFQVRKLAGKEDLDLAKAIIRRHFLVAGTVNRFDEFLVLLAAKLGRPMKDFIYQKKNISTSRAPVDIPDDFLDRLKAQNQLDQQLFEWVDSGLYSEYVAAYEGDFSSDLERFKSLQRASQNPIVRPIIDSVYRNAYLKPLTGLIRLVHGMHYSGSYN